MRARPDLTRRSLLVLVRLPLPLLALTFAASCGSKAPEITGVTVTVNLGDVSADQLEVSVTTQAGQAYTPQRRPFNAKGPLATPQSVSIYLPDALANEDATCTVTAFLADEPTGVGSSPVTLVLHRLVRVQVDLQPSEGDGAAPDGPPADGGETDAPAGDTSVGDAPDDTSALDGGATDASDAGPPSDGPKANGQTCGGNGECESTLCVDGVCCGTACIGTCEACNVTGKLGTCSPLTAGTLDPACANQPASSCSFDGTCNGSGACRRYPAGVACKAPACQGASYIPASACDGQGTCVAAAKVDCTPYICDATAAPPACRATCRAGGTDCISPAVCVNSSCGAKPKQPNGAGCVASADCTSAHCVDGVCCGTVCTGPCVSCKELGMEGMCVPVAAGRTDPHAMCKDNGATSCGTNGLCNGAGACDVYPATTVCAAATCASRYVRPARHCDGKGVCVAVTDVDCLPYRCDSATTACFASCTGSNQCTQAPKRTCQNSVCQ